MAEDLEAHVNEQTTCLGCLTSWGRKGEGRQERFGCKKYPKGGASGEGGQETQTAMWWVERTLQDERMHWEDYPFGDSQTLKNPSQPSHPRPIAVIQSLSHIQLFVTPWTAAHQASLSFTSSQSLLKFKSIEPVMSSNHPTIPPALESV